MCLFSQLLTYFVLMSLIMTLQSLVKHELLTAADEIQLARQYRLGQHVDTHAKKMS